MFDIGFAELLVIAVLGLIIIGPQRLPEVVRAISLRVGRLRRAFGNLKGEMEREFQIDEIRRQLHNEEILRQLEDVKQSNSSTTDSTEPAATDSHTTEPSQQPSNADKS